jgi:glucose/arabinose dehydrogenase
VRFFSSEDGLVATGRADVVAWEGEVQAASHQISDISIGPDGKLYVHIGDGFIASRGLDLNTVQGKICRINLDGTPAAGNPFYNAADGITARDYIWAYGYRNPWGGTWRAADGGHYEVENGPTRDRFAKVWAGQNARYDGSDNSMTNFALWTWKPPTAPVGVSFVEPQVFSGSGFPSSKWNSAFVTLTGPTWGTGPQTNLNASNGKRIQEFVLGASGQVTTQRWFLTYVGAGKATCAALAAGPDGLYFSDLYKDRDYQYAIDPGSKVWVVKYNASAAAAAATKPACRCAEGVPCAPQFSLGSTP